MFSFEHTTLTIVSVVVLRRRSDVVSIKGGGLYRAAAVDPLRAVVLRLYKAGASARAVQT